MILLPLLSAMLLLGACASQPYRYDPQHQASIENRAITQTDEAVRVSASVGSPDEISSLFGLPLIKSGIQPVWLEITNNSDKTARFSPYSVDPKYFPPHEVAYMHRRKFSATAMSELEARLHGISVPRLIRPGETVSGYVFTRLEAGTKAFNVDVHFIPNTVSNSHLSFFVDVPGFTPDHAAVDFASLYKPGDIEDLTADEFRAMLPGLPCCTRNRDGSAIGRPVDLFLVGSGQDVLKALLRAGWTENSLNKDYRYLYNIDYYFNRPPDAVFRIARDEGSSRNEMALWLAPIQIDGKPVWFGQVKHAITRLFDIGDYFFGAQLEPNAGEGRDYLLQNLWYAQSLAAFAFSQSGEPVPATSPRFDFNGKPWFTNGLKLVLWVSPEPLSLREARNLHWDRAVLTDGASSP